jgi:beta-galactosidase
MDPYRLPKFDYYEFMMQRDPNLAIPGTQMGPMVFIANYWTSTSPRNVEVYSNCEQVKLYVNGALIGTQSPTVTTYRAKVVFSNVPWQAGELKAEGLIGGVVKATYSVGTPGSADHIDLAADKCGMELVADGSDIMPVYAYVKDGNNTVMPVDSSLITFTVSGPAKIIGDGDTRVGANPVKAEAGIIGVLIQSTRTAGTITVTATSGSMKQGTVTFQSVPLADLVVTGPDQPAAGVLPQSPRPYSLPVLSRQNKDIAMIIDCAGRMLPRSIAAKAQSAAVYDLTGKLLFKTISGNASVPVNRGPGAVNRACVVRTKTMP